MDEVQRIFELIEEESAVSFLQSLVRINSVNPPGSERAVAEAIEKRLAGSGLNVEVDYIEEGRANLLAALPATGSDRNRQDRVLVYSGHFDTVPAGRANWDHDPFGGERVENRVYGRGTTDMKGGVSAMVLALECLHRSGMELRGTLRFVGTAGEEVNGLGAKRAVDKGQVDDATAMVVGEPSANEAFVAHKGALWLEVSTYGRSAHGSMPEQGINAIGAMRDFLNQLSEHSLEHENHPMLKAPTVNVGTIQGGVSINVVADQCTATLDIRTVPGQDHGQIVDDVERLLKEACTALGGSYEVRMVNEKAAVSTSEDAPFIRLSLETAQEYLGESLTPRGANYYTDASVYSPHLAIPVLIYGPGNPEMAHQPNEYVDVSRYMESIRFYIALAVKYLGA